MAVVVEGDAAGRPVAHGAAAVQADRPAQGRGPRRRVAALLGVDEAVMLAGGDETGFEAAPRVAGVRVIQAHETIEFRLVQARADVVGPLGRATVALALLVAFGVRPQDDLVSFDCAVAGQERGAAAALVDAQAGIGQRQRGAAGQGGEPRPRRGELSCRSRAHSSLHVFVNPCGAMPGRRPPGDRARHDREDPGGHNQQRNRRRRRGDVSMLIPSLRT